jgi:hypothetical protein
LKPELLASYKLVYREVCSEGSRTAKVCTDEQKLHKRHLVGDERPQQRKVRRIQNLLDVDAAGIGGRKKRLPGEVLKTTSWLYQEVSRGHSTCGKRGAKEMHRSHKQGRTERKSPRNSTRKVSLA